MLNSLAWRSLTPKQAYICPSCLLRRRRTGLRAYTNQAPREKPGSNDSHHHILSKNVEHRFKEAEDAGLLPMAESESEAIQASEGLYSASKSSKIVESLRKFVVDAGKAPQSHPRPDSRSIARRRRLLYGILQSSHPDLPKTVRGLLERHRLRRTKRASAIGRTRGIKKAQVPETAGPQKVLARRVRSGPYIGRAPRMSSREAGSRQSAHVRKRSPRSYDYADAE